MELFMLTGCWQDRDGTVYVDWLLAVSLWTCLGLLAVGRIVMELFMLTGCWQDRDGTVYVDWLLAGS